jgi:hypothetical protein
LTLAAIEKAFIKYVVRDWGYMPPDTVRVSPVIQRASSEGQKHHHRGDVGRLSEPTEWRLLHRLPLEIAADDPPGVGPLGFHDAGTD